MILLSSRETRMREASKEPYSTAQLVTTEPGTSWYQVQRPNHYKPASQGSDSRVLFLIFSPKRVRSKWYSYLNDSISVQLEQCADAGTKLSFVGTGECRDVTGGVVEKRLSEMPEVLNNPRSTGGVSVVSEDKCPTTPYCRTTVSPEADLALQIPAR